MNEPLRVATPPAKPVLIFDGDCQFCRRWIARWQETTGDRVEYRPYQDPQVATQFPELSRADLEQFVQLIQPDGSVHRGAEAVFQTLDRPWILWTCRHVPGFAPASELAYRFVARHRTPFSALTRLLWGKDVGRPQSILTRWLFLRLLGVIYLIAFVSLWTQIDGLIGSNGIVPIAPQMEATRAAVEARHIGLQRYWLLPTVCWFSETDRFLHALCGAGTALSVLLIVGIAPVPMLILLWAVYLSLTSVCGVFLGYQWDALLLETGFLAIWFAPLRLLPRLSRESAPPLLALWLLRLLLFKLMFCSGVVKLSSGDETWRNLTALTIHYETQPLPTWIGWYAHQLPVWFQKFSCATMFGIELGAPFLIFAPRRLRFVGCAALVSLQALIFLTGNYCFFNLLALALCVLLLDDAAIQNVVGANFIRDRSRLQIAPTLRMPRWRRWLIAPVAIIVLPITLVEIIGTFRKPVAWPAPVVKLYDWAAPFRTINGYGLFQVMTTSRPEIILEGSDDGVTWRAYEFKYKAGDLKGRPRFVEPHQPRLDWQMWFEALRYDPNYPPSPWFGYFCVRLLQGKPEVLALLKNNPFPDRPPDYLRATVYDYHFTDPATRQTTGDWWRRERRGLYLPMLSARDLKR